jgi:acyl carrier protein
VNKTVSDERSFGAVTQVLRALPIAGIATAPMGRDSRLVDELGLDSLLFVDLTVALELALELPEFPMQDWVDGELEAGRPLTVGALADACARLCAAKVD